MKFRMFTDSSTGDKFAINIDRVISVLEDGEGTQILTQDDSYSTREDFATVISRLNTIAE